MKIGLAEEAVSFVVDIVNSGCDGPLEDEYPHVLIRGIGIFYGTKCEAAHPSSACEGDDITYLPCKTGEDTHSITI